MTDKKHFYITTPIYYVNDKPHIGHAYTTLSCDVLARFKRMQGYTVRFLTGTDEHGQKVEKAAAQAGLSPQDFTDRVSGNFRDLAKRMNFSNDDFIRTTEPRHRKAAQALWNRLQQNGQIYAGSYQGWYAVRDEAYYTESELTETADGKKIAPGGAEVEWVCEDSYFFRLSQWQDRLLDYYTQNPDFILPVSRRNEVISFVSGGLKDLSISRTAFSWGIPAPAQDGHVMYVWLDALTNYLTAVGFPDQENPDYRAFWPADLHMVGKDILRFHAVYWPAFLMAAGLQPPRRVFAHGWWTNEGQKISKSLGNVIDPLELVERYGLDQVRYFLMRAVPFGNDGDFSHDAMVTRMDKDLANDFGNLAQRVLSMIARNCNGVLPAPGASTASDRALASAVGGLTERLREQMDAQAFHKALEAIWEVVGAANRYVDMEAPWALKRSNPQRMESVLYNLANGIRILAILASPFMPQSCARMLDQLAVPAEARDIAALAKDIPPGVTLPKPEPIFPRYMAATEEKIPGEAKRV